MRLPRHLLLPVLLLLGPLSTLVSAQGVGQQPPLDPTNGKLLCSSYPRGPAALSNYRKALHALVTNAATAPFLGASGIATRRRCYQQQQQRQQRQDGGSGSGGDGGSGSSSTSGAPCTVLARYHAAKIAVCGDAFASMLCQDVADVVVKILDGCGGGGGEWVLAGSNFSVKVHG